MRKIVLAVAACCASAPLLAQVAVSPLQPGSPPSRAPTDAEIATSPAVKRLKELLKVVNSGDAAAMKVYLEPNGVDAMKPPQGPPGALPLLGSVLDLHRRSHGLDLMRVAKVDEGGATAVVRNRLTGDEQPLAIKIEPQPPHRIIGFPAVPMALAGALLRPDASGPLSEQAQLQQIGSYLERLGDADVFSGVVVITRDGKPVFSRAYGYADREKKIRNSSETAFLVGSINKLFTGLAIGQLVEQGKLSYEDPLSKFLPDIPDPESAKRIKIKHLLSHTSGIGGSPKPNSSTSVDRPLSVQAVLNMVAWEAPKFEPGTKWAYSNGGFQLLGRIIEIVTGENYYDYMQRNVFAPAGMTSTSFPHYDRDAVAMAQPYELELNGDALRYVNKLATMPPRGGPPGHGTSSAPDLIRLSNALRAGRIVKPETFRLHASPKPELGSPTYGYGFGTSARMARRPLVGHGGNSPGQCSQFGALTDTPYTIVVLSNATISTCISVTGKILQSLASSKAPAA